MAIKYIICFIIGILLFTMINRIDTLSISHEYLDDGVPIPDDRLIYIKILLEGITFDIKLWKNGNNSEVQELYEDIEVPIIRFNRKMEKYKLLPFEIIEDIRKIKIGDDRAIIYVFQEYDILQLLKAEDWEENTKNLNGDDRNLLVKLLNIILEEKDSDETVGGGAVAGGERSESNIDFEIKNIHEFDVEVLQQDQPWAKINPSPSAKALSLPVPASAQKLSIEDTLDTYENIEQFKKHDIEDLIKYLIFQEREISVYEGKTKEEILEYIHKEFLEDAL